MIDQKRSKCVLSYYYYSKCNATDHPRVYYLLHRVVLFSQGDSVIDGGRDSF